MKIVKVCLILLLAGLVTLGLTVVASAEELDFSASAEDAAIERRSGIFDVFPEYHPKFKGDFEEGVTFGVSFSYIKSHDWVNINLVRADRLPDHDSGYLGNVGITLLLQGGDNSFLIRLVTEDTTWDAPLVSLQEKVPGILSLGDENWHIVSVSKATGSWSLTVDGIEAFSSLTAEQSEVVDSLIGGGEGGFISCGSASGKGMYQIGEGAVVEAILEELRANTEAPETDPPAPVTENTPETASPATEKPAENAPTVATEKPSETTPVADPAPGGTNGALWIYLAAGAVIVAAIVVIVISLKKKTKVSMP